MPILYMGREGKWPDPKIGVYINNLKNKFDLFEIEVEKKNTNHTYK